MAHQSLNYHTPQEVHFLSFLTKLILWQKFVLAVWSTPTHLRASLLIIAKTILLCYNVKKMLMTMIVAELKSLRDSKKISQKDFAHALKVSQHKP